MKYEGGYIIAEVKIPAEKVYKDAQGRLSLPWSTHKDVITLPMDGVSKKFTITLRIGAELKEGGKESRGSKSKSVIELK